MKAALYARVSTNDKGQNPETQLRKLRAFAEARGYEVTREYVDWGFSGKNDDRPQFRLMLDHSRRRNHGVILVVKLDRMMRSLTNFLTVLENLDKWGVGLECVDQSIDTRSASGRLMIQITAAFAEWERELIRERVNDGIARARAEGTALGRPRLPDEAVSPDAARMRRYRERKRNKTPSPEIGVSLNINAPEAGRNESGG